MPTNPDLTAATPPTTTTEDPVTTTLAPTATPPVTDQLSGELHITGLTKSFTKPARGTFRRTAATSQLVLGPVDLTVSAGEFISVLGPSGCGKSTLLSMIAGLAVPSTGTISLDGEAVTGPGRDRGVVFQQHVLLPWLSAKGNIEFALADSRRQLTAAQRSDLAQEYLELVHLGHAADKHPGELSGGMQQRVGIARALAIEPKVLLLDEPFGALDALTRLSLQDELLDIWESARRTVVMVTHDVDEALRLSDRIIVLSPGPGSQIVSDIAVPFARPRDVEQLSRQQDYQQLRADLLASLLPGHHAATTS